MPDVVSITTFVISVVSMLVCLLVKVQIPVPKCISSKRRIRIDYTVPPLFGVIVLLASGTMTIGEVWRGGIVGDKDIRPYVIIILFNALAYICVSLDATGCLTYISLKVAQAAGSSRLRLFFYFYVLSAIMTSVTNNDMVVMALTPVVLQCSKFTGTNPSAYLFSVVRTIIAAHSFVRPSTRASPSSCSPCSQSIHPQHHLSLMHSLTHSIPYSPILHPSPPL